MELFKCIAFVFLALHALIDLILAVITYHQVGNVGPSIFLICICCLFSFTLFPALSDDEFSRRWFPGKWYRGPIETGGDPVAYWFTFAVLVLFHLFITVSIVRLVHW